MLAKITLYDGTVYKIASQTVDTEDGIYLGRIKDELSIVSAMQEAGNAPETISLTIINYDNFIPHNKDLWAADVLLTNDNNISWRGKINFCNFDSDGNLYVTASEKTAPELELQLPDEVRQVYTVDEDFHQSSVTMTIPLVIGGTTSNPITLSTILIDKTRGIYLICVGEIRSIVKVYNGAEQLPQTAYTAYTGTADQQENAGFAYVQIAEDYRLNSDGTYAEINVDVVGLKLGNHTEAECRNGARFLYYFLTTADTGVNGWGCGIDSSLIDSDSFQSAITLCNQLGYKLDGIMWLRQSAQSWIDQICQAIHGKYSINANGKRSLFIDYAGNASKKTFTASNMQVDRYGKNSYTSVVYNKGVLSYDYNPITGLFMQSAQYENADSIAQIGEQKFIGESYLIKDATTALAVLEYTCKRSQIAAEAIEFKTDDVETNLRAGDIITINRPDLNLNNALYQIQSISTTDFISSIIAVKFDTSVFSVTGTASTVNWGNERDITPALTPAMATSLNLSTGFDINPDGTGIPYISGTFTVPEGGWLAAAVQYGIGADPTNWTELSLITEGSFKIAPVNVGTVYAIRVRMITATGHSDYLKNVITSTGDTIPPSKPTISAKATDRTVTIQCGLDQPPADMGGFQIYRKKSTDSESAYTYIGSIAANRGYAAFSDYVDEYVTYNYKAKSYDRSGNLSTQFSDVANVAITGIEAVSLAASAIAMPTGSILRLSAKNCTAASIAETNGVKDCSGYGHHGQAGSGMSIVNDEEKGTCFYLNGTANSYATIPANLGYSNEFTLCAWFKKKGSAANSWHILFGGYEAELDVGDGNGAARIGTCDNDNNRQWLDGGSVTDGKWHHIAGTVSCNGTTTDLILYVDGEKVGNKTVELATIKQPTERKIGQFASTNAYRANCYLYDPRIYPRALSATEIKSIFMIPDETVFAQLTTDMFGANIIHANYILNDGAFQTLAVNAVNANINDLNVAGNATFTGLSNKVTAKYGTCSTAAATAAKVVTLSNFDLFTGAQISVKFTNTNSVANPTLNVNSTGAKTIRAKGANLTASSLYNWVAGDVVNFVYDGTYWVISDISAKDYSNTELAKKMSIASYCSANDTTKIDGANIYAGSVTAIQMAANAITAEKISVTAIKKPSGAWLDFTPKNLPATLNINDTIPNIACNWYNFNGTVKGASFSTSAESTNGRRFELGAGVSSCIQVPSGYVQKNWTWRMKCIFTQFSHTPILFRCSDNASSPVRLISILVSSSGKLYGYIWSSSSSQLGFSSNATLSLNTLYDLVITASGSVVTIYINGVVDKTYNFATVNFQAVGIGIFNAETTALQSARSFAGYCYNVMFYVRCLSADEVKALYNLGTDTESGQITADRLAVDAIRSRNASGGSDGGYTTAGSKMDLTLGWLSFPKCCISSSGVIKATDVDLTGKITATSGKFGDCQINTNDSESKYCSMYLTSSKYNAFCIETTGDFIQWLRGSQRGVVIEANPAGVGESLLVLNKSDSNRGGAGCRIESYGADSLIVKYKGTDSAASALYVTGKAYCSAGVWSGCDENLKKDIKDVSTLDKLKSIRVKKFKYSEKKVFLKDWAKDKKNEIKYNVSLLDRKTMPEPPEDNENSPEFIMAMAGEFNKAFGVDNGNEESINYTNAVGVALRSIQELAEIVDSQKAEIAELKALLKNSSKDNDSEKELIEPSFEELLKDDENQEEGQKK